MRFEKVLDASKWHEDVQCFVVYDAASGAKLGYFYLDMYTRTGKYSHAAVFPIAKRVNVEGK